MNSFYDEYIIFVLGVDYTTISRAIRDKLDECSDLYEMYNVCKTIAEQFEIYDQNNVNIMSQIDSFYKFIVDYEKELLDYINGDTQNFKVKKEIIE